MSNSRLEKFIYAICGMDVDDLPTPLSRIETLWNCLITGEMPDFEPLSRNEKYLMVMLNGDIDGLPEPTSRSEKLLYKITTGETDLSDVPGYLSGYEELLKQLIENGGIGGTDFEYVLYTLKQPLSTLYSTAEAPVKSAILKGNTLVNLFDIDSISTINGGSGNQNNDGWITFTNDGNINSQTMYYNSLSQNIKIGEKYIAFLYIDKNTIGDVSIEAPHAGYYLSPMKFDTISTIGIYVSKPFIANFSGGNTKEKTINFRCITRSTTVGELKFRMIILPYQDNMENWDIPYFEGMQSVKMPVLTTTGKNLFELPQSDKMLKGSIGKYIKLNLKPNTNYTYNSILDKKGNTSEFDFYGWISNDINSNFTGHKVFHWKLNKTFSKTFNTGNDEWYFHVHGEQKSDDYRNYLINFQLEEGSTATSHEPYKSNILSINGEYRGIGNVQDTLDLNTGEKVERIGEMILNGNEKWATYSGGGEKEKTVAFRIPSSSHIHSWGDGLGACDKLPFVNGDTIFSKDIEGITSDANGFIIRISKKKCTDLQSLKVYLLSNPIKIQYRLKTPIIKTVVLSTLDQDGQPTKLSTFNDITHVSIEAEDLLPIVDLEVATKIEETLSSLPKQMIDISETQQSLNEKIDAQAENIKEVSTAMIEIRNDIL